MPIITPEQARTITSRWFQQYSDFSHDIETNGENPILNKLLLEAWYPNNTSEPTIVVDSTSVGSEEIVNDTDLKDKDVYAHNADFEARWGLVRGLRSWRLKCTMVREQVLLSGASELKYNIIACLQRRKIPIPEVMNKEIRDEFVGKDLDMIFEDKHILYNAGDVWKLKELYDAQQHYVNTGNLNFLVNQIRMPLIQILAECELTGFVHDKESWLRLAQQRDTEAKEIAKELDKLVEAAGLNLLECNPALADLYESKANKLDKLKARKTKLEAELARLEGLGKTHLKIYVTQRISLDKVNSELDGWDSSLPAPHVNWASSNQAIKVLEKLGVTPLPSAKDNKTHKMKIGVGKAARNNWFADNPNHQFIVFMTKFDKFKKLEHNVKSFGEKWVETYTNSVTGKVHTIFRQSSTRTLRFSSGDKSKGYFNLQQIPGKLEYRKCFGTDPGRSIATLDYTGCEIICMISLSRDLELKRISELPDQHSYMGTKCWRAVYAHRYAKTNDPKWKELAETYEMTKEGGERKKFKESGVFPVIYGVRASKVAGIQGFQREEGQIFIDTIEAEMPNVVTFVKEKAKFALQNGYVLHNTRTNSRRWFTKVLDAIQYNKDLADGDLVTIETAARNAPIQGTNADIICEAIVTINRWARLYKVDVRLLGQVHDELIYDFPDELTWVPGKLKKLMEMTAKRYLIKEIDMAVDCHVEKHWVK